jgi:hypothetical protein
MESTVCYEKSMAAMTSLVAMEDNGCYRKVTFAMGVIESSWCLWKSVVHIESQWLL